jgi:hypothetical protein
MAKLTGTNTAETLIGTPDSDQIDGFAGDDFIYGLDGDDYLAGGPGNDQLYGGLGHDVIQGDWVEFEGDDIIYGGGGDDYMFGGRGNDIIYGGPGNGRQHEGNGGNDIIFGEAGNDTEVQGSQGNDIHFGGLGNDQIYADPGRDLLYGGSGDDQLDGENTFVHFEDPIPINNPFPGPDILYGEAGNDWLEGAGGADILFGGAGDDTLLPGAGFDWIYGGGGSDTIRSAYGIKIIDGGDGNDKFDLTNWSNNNTRGPNDLRAVFLKLGAGENTITFDTRKDDFSFYRVSGKDDTFVAIGNGTKTLVVFDTNVRFFQFKDVTLDGLSRLPLNNHSTYFDLGKDVFANNIGLDLSTSQNILKVGELNFATNMRDIMATTSEGVKDRIIELYSAYLKLIPDAQALSQWTTFITGGHSYEELAKQLYTEGAGRPEVSGYSSSMSNEAFVRAAFNSAYGKSGSTVSTTKEIDSWVAKISSGAVSRENLIADLLKYARENGGQSTWSDVNSLLDNRIEVGQKFAVDYGITYSDQNLGINKRHVIFSAIASNSPQDAFDLFSLESFVPDVILENWEAGEGGKIGNATSLLQNGNFVIAWHNLSTNVDGETLTGVSAIEAQIFSPSGKKIGSVIQPIQEPNVIQAAPSVTSISSDRFVIVWQEYDRSKSNTSTGWDIKAQVFSNNGQSSSNKITINTSSYENQFAPHVLALENGNFCVFWSDKSNQTFIRYQIFSSDGAPIGKEMSASDFKSAQYISDVALLKDGNLIVCWNDFGVDGSGSGVFFQIISNDGGKLAKGVANTSTIGTQFGGELTVLESGSFVITWYEFSSLDKKVYFAGDKKTDVKAQIFSNAGIKVGSEIAVNTNIIDDQYGQTITALKNGGFVIVWQDHSAAPTNSWPSWIPESNFNWAVRAQVFASDGARIGSEILVNKSTDENQFGQSVIALKNGGFVVAWQGYCDEQTGTTGDGSGWAVKAQVFSADGKKVGSEIIVNTATESYQCASSLEALEDGGFFITWQDLSKGNGGAAGDTSGWAVKAQIFTADGGRTGSEFLVNTNTEGDQFSATSTLLYKTWFAESLLNFRKDESYLLDGITQKDVQRIADALGNTDDMANYLNPSFNYSISGSLYADNLVGSSKNDFVDGYSDFDTFRFNGSIADYVIARNGKLINIKDMIDGRDGLDILMSIERLIFKDMNVIVDVVSANGPAAYRLYGGAFDRTPDEGGFRYWAQTLDAGVSLNQVAGAFIGSAEFTARYGNNLSNSAFVDALYQNVLHRPGEAAGVAYWNDVLNKNLGSRSDLLVSFTQLPEYVGISMKNIENGYWVV